MTVRWPPQTLGVHCRGPALPPRHPAPRWRDGAQRLLRPRVSPMKVKYFKETDTALLKFSEAPVHETRELSESVYVDLDDRGNPVSMTIEHATQLAQFPVVTLEGVGSRVA